MMAGKALRWWQAKSEIGQDIPSVDDAQLCLADEVRTDLEKNCQVSLLFC